MPKGLLQEVTWRSATLVLFELVLILAAIGTAAYVRLGSDMVIVIRDDQGLLKALLVTFVCVLCMYYNDLYDDPRLVSGRDLAVNILQALGATSILLAIAYYWYPDLILGRGVFAISVAFVVISLLAWRIAFTAVILRVGPRRRLLMVGTSPGTVDRARELHQRYELGLQVVGFVDSDPQKIGTSLFNPAVVGTIDDIPRIVREHGIDKVVISLEDARGKLPMQQLLEMRLRGVEFEHLATLYEQYTGKIAVEHLRPSWLIFSSGFPKHGWRQAIKRSIDVVASGIGVVLAAPVMLLVAAAVRLTSPGPVLYSQPRVGQGGRIFTVYKFRSMRQDAEAGTGAVWAQPGDSRITPVGKWLRRTRLDELPQLWNVLRGDMSLVGPRPERPEFVAALTEQIPFYGQRHVIKPGLSGWAQVRYTYGASVEDAMQKLQYDLFYIKNFSLMLDLVIVFETIKTVILRRGA